MSSDTPSSTTTINLGAVTTLVDQNDRHDIGGSQQLAALQMAVNEFNDKTDGILDDLLPDVQVKLAVRDGRDDFAQSVIHGLEFTNKMFKSVGGIHAVLSFAGDDVTKGLASVLSTADVPLLTSTTVAELSKADRYPTTLRLLPSDAYQGATFGQLMKSSHWDVRRVIAFSSTDSFDTLLEFTTAAKAHGVKVVDSYVIEDFQEDFSDVIKDAKAHRCKNFVFFNKRAADASLLLLQGADVGLFSPLSTLFFHQQLHSDELHAAVVAKHGPAILRGAVVLTPLTDAWKHRSAGQAFLKRYLAQPDTVAADAQCDDAVDDTGRPVYVSETGEGAAVCAGLRFSEMARDGRDVSPLVAYAYDAVVVYLRAVENLLQTGAVTHGQIRRQGISGKLVKRTAAESVHVVGVTENISFSTGRAGSKVYGYGDRDKGVGFAILNWQVENATGSKQAGGGFRHVGSWSADNGLQLCDAAASAWRGGGCHLPVHYASKDGFSRPPPDHGSTSVLPFAVAATVIVVSTLMFFLRRRRRKEEDGDDGDGDGDGDADKGTKGSRGSGSDRSSKLRNSGKDSNNNLASACDASVSSNIVIVNNVPVEVPVVQWSDLVIDDQSPVLGRGSFGFVFRGMWLDPEDNVHHEVAVKVMSRQVCKVKDMNYEDLLHMARQEAALTISAAKRGRRIENSITCVYGFAEGPLPEHLTDQFAAKEGEEAFGMVMRLEKGGSLSDNMYKSNDFYSMTEKIRILLGIAQGLVKLHSINVIHGDLKPANILFSEHNPPEVRIADFGMSAIRDKEALGTDSLYMTRLTKGTVKYCAPEMLNDEGNGVARASRRTDIYAFAVMAWEILANKRPFEHLRTERMLEKGVVAGERPSLEDLPSDTPPAIKEMIRQCWDGARDKRLTASECYATLSTAHAQLSTGEYDIFFSHRWANKPFLSHLHHLLCEHGYRVWYDANEMGFDLVKSMTQGIEKSTVVVCCVDSEYAKSANCMLELRHAHKVIEARTARTRALIAVTTEGSIRLWPGSDEVRTLLDVKTKMYVDLSELASLTDPNHYGDDGAPINAWEAPDGATEHMMTQLREQTKPLFKLLKIVGCVPSVKHTATDLAMLMRTMSGRRLLSTDGSTIMTKFSSDSDNMSRSGSLNLSFSRNLGGSRGGSRNGSRAGSRIISRPGTPLGPGGLVRAVTKGLGGGEGDSLASSRDSSRGGSRTGSRIISRPGSPLGPGGLERAVNGGGGGSGVWSRGGSGIIDRSAVTSTETPSAPVSVGSARNATLVPDSLSRS